MSQKVRIRLKSYDHKILDKVVMQIIEVAERANVHVAGPVPLPTSVERYSVIRSGFIDKDSQEQFEIRIHKRLIDLISPNQQTINMLTNLEFTTGVSVELETLINEYKVPEDTVLPPLQPKYDDANIVKTLQVEAVHSNTVVTLEDTSTVLVNPFKKAKNTPSTSNNEYNSSRSYDRLLLWLSATGKGNWRTFQNACQALGIVDKKHTPTTILRRLRLLGHVETSSDRSKWTIAPSVLVKRENPMDDEEEYFLCGARDVHMVGELQEIARVSEHLQVYGHAPVKVSIHLCNLEQMSHLHVADNVAYRLAQRLPPLAGWMDTLQVLPGVSPYQFIIRKFNGTSFEDKPFDGSKSGMYEL